MKEMRRIDRELFEGVKYRHHDWMIVRQLIMAGANPNIRDEYGQNLLYHIQNAEVARGLIKAGANLENRDENECTPLFAVTEPAIAELFLLSGANVNATDRFGRTPLFMTKNVKIAELLLQYGANPNAQDNSGVAPLHLGTEQIVELLLQHGANPRIRDREGNTPLHEPQAPRAIKSLLIHGADIHARNDRQETPFATMFVTSDEIFQTFLEAGADPNAPNEYGFTPLFAAGTRRQVELLVQYGADLNLRLPDGSTALFHTHSAFMARILLDFGADATIRDEHGHTCLHMDYRCSFPEKILLAPMLLKAGADPADLAESLRQEPEIADFITIQFCDFFRYGFFAGLKPSKLNLLTVDQMIEMLSHIPADERKAVSTRSANGFQYGGWEE